LSLVPVVEPSGEPQSATRIVGAKVFVERIPLMAEIGVYPHERGRAQALEVDVELDVAMAHAERLADTLNYETIAEAARRVAETGHMALVETFAERLAEVLLADARVSRARVRVRKPGALAPAVAGVEVTAVRA
jgi:7,8-dihydroneopterin aldolase/epimerase/oxygenase